jgi:bacterioferritin (cytochrome b1)
MALFQNSVLKRHLKGLDDDLMAKKYETFSQYFLHPTIQENIRASKEEQFQATFLNELFVKILGYTLKPSLNYNLTTEYKNVKDAKKADGAILQDEKAIAVIELKGTNTTSLDKVESQAFGYKNNHCASTLIMP